MSQNNNDNKIEWMTKKNWNEFRATGLLWFINSILHVFGWSIVVEVDDQSNEVTNCYPARVKYRGFDEASNTEGHLKIANYLNDNASELKKEAEL